MVQDMYSSDHATFSPQRSRHSQLNWECNNKYLTNIVHDPSSDPKKF